MFDFDALDAPEDPAEGERSQGGGGGSSAGEAEPGLQEPGQGSCDSGKAKAESSAAPCESAGEVARQGAAEAAEAGTASSSVFDFDTLEQTDPSVPPPAAAESSDGEGPVTAKGKQLLQAALASMPHQDAVDASGQAGAAQGAPGGNFAEAVDTAKAAAKSYWRVIKTIDPAGIAVRSDNPRSAGGRLQLHSVVVEKEKKGNELRYEALGGYTMGPRSGWIKIESKGSKYLECLGDDYKQHLWGPTAKSTQKMQALILFDWDDTLCPTSWIEECPSLRNAVEGQVARTGEVWEKLCEQAEAVKELMETAASLGTVAVVTLAERPWVSVSVEDFMPAARSVMTMEVFYAREGQALRGAPGACLLTAMKRRAMDRALNGMITRMGKGTTWESFISIGDSEVEKRAAQDLGREFQNKGLVKYTKTVKMIEHPNVKQLTSQCRTLKEKLRELVIYPGHRHINSADLMKKG